MVCVFIWDNISLPPMQPILLVGVCTWIFQLNLWWVVICLYPSCSFQPPLNIYTKYLAHIWGKLTTIQSLLQIYQWHFIYFSSHSYNALKCKLNWLIIKVLCFVLFYFCVEQISDCCVHLVINFLTSFSVCFNWCSNNGNGYSAVAWGCQLQVMPPRNVAYSAW